MKKVIPLIIALAFASLPGASAQLIVKTIDQSELNLGWMTVRDLPADGNAFQFGSAWPVADLVATFASASSVTLSPATISTNDSFWYTQPGNVGNKMMSALLLAEASRGSLSGDTLSFRGVVTNYSLLTNSTGIPYSFSAIIQEFVPGGGYNQALLPLTGAGTFELSLALDSNPNTAVQWGFLLSGPNIWPGNTAELATAGSVTVIPEPTTYALLGLAAVGGLIARRLRRKA
jgi:hypothetical protein